MTAKQKTTITQLYNLKTEVCTGGLQEDLYIAYATITFVMLSVWQKSSSACMGGVW
jgi:hypothetical protein